MTEGNTIASITLEEAQRIIQAAQEKAQEIGQPMNVAVVDNGRNLKAFARMEDAWLGSIDIAIDKAFTSASFLLPTEDLADMTQPGQPLYGLEATNGGRVVIFGGGIPLTRNGEVAGAIGVSGGTVDQDQDVAEAGVAVFE
ncbi:MAG: heme-binding protein [Actinobacteria bacterium]|nr:heme-binding protein [Actinomycetota bacterium]MCA1738428.1 heme-binding protein [Actinomycetota bacterium]